MPIHSLGYRKWSGPLESRSSRWKVIAGVGIRRAWQNMWLRRIMFFAWVPGVVMGFLIFGYERAAEHGNSTTFMFQNLLKIFIQGPSQDAVLSGLANPEFSGSVHEQRHLFWSSLLLTLFQRSQVMMLIPVVGMIAPPLISQDMRSRAFLLYFSRPISRMHYILGKAATVALYLLLISFLPGFLLYCTGVLLSPDISIVLYTWDLPLRVLVVSAVMIIPTTALALMISSLTTESRFASFAWFSVWIFGLFANWVIASFSGPVTDRSPLEMLSLYHVIRDVQGWLLDVNQEGVDDPGSRLVLLLMLTVVSLAVLFRRVSAPMRV